MQGEFGLLKNNVFIGVIFFRAKTGEEMKKSNETRSHIMGIQQ